jgi:hypothetical protein
MRCANSTHHFHQDPEKYKYQILVAIGDFQTMNQIEDSYKRATGRAISSVPKAMAWFITRTNKPTQELYVSLYMSIGNKSNQFINELVRQRIGHLERHQHMRADGEYPELEEEIRLANDAYTMRSYYEWVKQGKKEAVVKEGWNKLYVGKLLTGRF